MPCLCFCRAKAPDSSTPRVFLIGQQDEWSRGRAEKTPRLGLEDLVCDRALLSICLIDTYIDNVHNYYRVAYTGIRSACMGGFHFLTVVVYLFYLVSWNKSVCVLYVGVLLATWSACMAAIFLTLTYRQTSFQARQSQAFRWLEDKAVNQDMCPSAGQITWCLPRLSRSTLIKRHTQTPTSLTKSQCTGQMAPTTGESSLFCSTLSGYLK